MVSHVCFLTKQVSAGMACHVPGVPLLLEVLQPHRKCEQGSGPQLGLCAVHMWMVHLPGPGWRSEWRQMSVCFLSMEQKGRKDRDLTPGFFEGSSASWMRVK